MKLIDRDHIIIIKELKDMAENLYGDLVKAVVDIEREIMVIDADLHADEEKELLDKGSKQKNLWGINLYPDLYGKEDFVEFDSMINLRPSQNNMTRGVGDDKTRKKIIEIVNRLVKEK